MSLSLCIYIYIYIYIYKSKGTAACPAGATQWTGWRSIPPGAVRPISLLRFTLLGFVDSNFPGNPLWAWEFHPSILRLCLSQAP